MINWGGFLIASVIASLVPGASQVLGLRNAVRYGVVEALIAVSGRLAAFVILIGLVVLGLGAVLATSAAAFEVIRWIGVAYLLWIGVNTLRHSVRGSALEITAATVGRQRLVTQEFVVGITNPKALILFAALLPQFVATTDHATLGLAVVSFAYLLVELVVATGYACIGARLRAAKVPGKANRRVQRATGVAFVGLAGYLALQQAP